jgi:hypothetical protein
MLLREQFQPMSLIRIRRTILERLWQHYKLLPLQNHERELDSFKGNRFIKEENRRISSITPVFCLLAELILGSYPIRPSNLDRQINSLARKSGKEQKYFKSFLIAQKKSLSNR